MEHNNNNNTFKQFLTEILNGGSGVTTSNILSSVQQTKSRLKRIKRGWEEEAETSMKMGAPKIEIARNIFKQMVNAPNATRKHIIHTMMRRAGVTHSTAVSYYERLAKEAGITNTDAFGKGRSQIGSMGFGANPISAQQQSGQQGQMQQMYQPQVGQQPEQEKELIHTFPDDPKRQGIIRHVDGAHLVRKIQTPNGTFEELWIYNIGPDMNDDLTIRRNILAGTDIPAQKTRSPDGSQSYDLTNLGNAQLLHIDGLLN